MTEKKRTNIYFASDAHLGSRYLKDPIATEKKLVKWLDSIKEEAKEIWFLGDMFDFWFEYKYVVPKGHVRFLGKLAELSDNGVEIHMLTGNHDIWMFEYFEKELGISIHRNPIITQLYGKTFYLAHGDELDQKNWSFQLIQKIFRNPICQKLYASIHPRWSFGFAFGWSLNSRKSGLKKQKNQEYRGESGEYLVNFAKKHLKENSNINFYIFGHRHIMLDLMLSTSARILIAGDWMQHYSYIVWNGEQLFLEQFEPEF